jgi:hypothetical protein
MIFDRKPFNLSYHVAVNSHVIKQSKREIIKLSCQSFLASVPALINSVISNNVFYLGGTKPNKSFFKDITQGINEGYTVTYVAMQLAYFMGFKNIYLIGVDHNFNQMGSPNETQKMEGNDPNHFDPNYFKGQEWQLADLEASEVSYVIANYYFSKDGRKIFDATLNGKLNVFDKIDFNEAIKLAKKK